MAPDADPPRRILIDGGKLRPVPFCGCGHIISPPARLCASPVARAVCLGFCDREDQFPITIRGPNNGRPRWLAGASAPALPVAELVAGGVPRNQRAPASWGGP
jgi:hypothetical protein